MPSKSEAAMDLQRPVEPTPLATTDALPLSFEGFVQAVSAGQLTAEAVEKLTNVFLKVQDHKAVQQYNVAFAAFREECPPPPRDQVREWTKAGDEGVGWKTHYADMETILRTVQPVLVRHGLSISFGDAELKEAKGAMVLTERCRCSHIGGHSETASSPMTLESSSPAMSAQDRYDGASTRAQRRALCKVLGIWTEGYKADPPTPPAPSPLLTEQQRQHIEKLGDLVGQNWEDLYRWWGIANFADATQDKYAAAVKFLEQKKQKQTKGTP